MTHPIDPAQARIVVIGAGQAGAALAAKLRALGHAGPLSLIGAEDAAPYQRPPLSKAYLKGEIDHERLRLRPASFYVAEKIDLITGTTVASLDREGRRVMLGDGRDLPYDLLALTTGAEPRRLPVAIGGDLAGVFTMRDLADADALAGALLRGARALIVGGGYIGLEAAAVLAQAELEVTLIEQAPRILARVAAPATADYFRTLHRGHGVDIREAVGLDHLTSADGRVTGAVLSNGARLEVDLVLVGIGVAPRDGLARGAGLETENGIRVDGAGRTSDPVIFAAGDCASFPHEGQYIRLESVPNAIEQAEIVAEAMLGGDVHYVARPWFWSDQYDVKLQIAGLGAGFEATITRPGARPGSQSVWYWRGGRLIAVDAMNDPRAYMTGKRWIEAGISPDPAGIADPASDLRALV